MYRAFKPPGESGNALMVGCSEWRIPAAAPGPPPQFAEEEKEQSHWEMHGPHLIKGTVVLTASIKVLSRDATG